MHYAILIYYKNNFYNDFITLGHCELIIMMVGYYNHSTSIL